jgi:hypothetical protein
MRPAYPKGPKVCSLLDGEEIENIEIIPEWCPAIADAQSEASNQKYAQALLARNLMIDIPPNLPQISPEQMSDRAEQARIVMALTEAMPENVHYHNLVMALAQLQQRIVGEYVRAMRAEGEE